jgi:hypothetical protein
VEGDMRECGALCVYLFEKGITYLSNMKIKIEIKSIVILLM